MTENNLSIRLQAVFDMLPETSGRMIDVGSDHGLLALEILNSHKASSVVCTDIHQAPANRTKECLAGANYSSVSEVFCTDGLKGVELKNHDVIAIAGMGGNTIIDILTAALNDNSADVLKNVTWCLQPQKSIDVLRRFLGDSGFELIDEAVCIDRGFHYVLIKVRYVGIPYQISAMEAYYGIILPDKVNEPDVKSYYNHLDEVYSVRARGCAELAELLEERNGNT